MLMEHGGKMAAVPMPRTVPAMMESPNAYDCALNLKISPAVGKLYRLPANAVLLSRLWHIILVITMVWLMDKTRPGAKTAN